MGRTILMLYVTISALVIGLSVIATIITGKARHALSNDDWFIFILACGALSVSEALEGKRK